MIPTRTRSHKYLFVSMSIAPFTTANKIKRFADRIEHATPLAEGWDWSKAHLDYWTESVHSDAQLIVAIAMEAQYNIGVRLE